MNVSHKTRNYRFYVPELAGHCGKCVELSIDQAHHGRDVLRLASGRTVELFDGQGAVARGRIDEITRRKVCVEVGCVEMTTRIGPAIHLAFAVPKGKRLDWLVEKATELGAASLQPVVFKRSVAGGEQISQAASQRWLAHCISAARQCRLNFLPEIREHVTLDDFIKDTGQIPTLLGDTGEDAITLVEALQSTIVNRQSSIRILIGPEGGLTDSEHLAAISAGCLPVRLGHTTLRIETAAIGLLAGTVAIV